MTTNFIAWLGAVTGMIGSATGILALLLQWKQHRADRSNIQLAAKMGIAYDPQKGRRPVLQVKVTNLGRRLCRIARVWLPQACSDPINADCRMVTSDFVLFEAGPERPPIELQEAEPKEFRLDPFPVDKDTEVRSTGSLVCVRLTDGREFQARFKLIDPDLRAPEAQAAAHS